MNKICIIFLSIYVCTLLGCSSKVQTQYVDVYIPVKTEIERPTRPIFTNDDIVATYLVKVLNYVKKLELIIDIHNKGE